MTIRAHFNGTVIVPDEPVDLPVDAVLSVEVHPLLATAPANSATIARRLEALQRFIDHGVTATNIPPEQLRREHLYDDRA